MADMGKVEYIVVNYDENDPKVTLSLRQADILHSLAHDDELTSQGGCVPDLQDVASAKYRLSSMVLELF